MVLPETFSDVNPWTIIPFVYTVLLGEVNGGIEGVTAPAVPTVLFVAVTEVDDAATVPKKAKPRATWLITQLFKTKAFAVAPVVIAPVTDVIAVGVVVLPFGPTITPKVVFSLPVVDVAVLKFLPVALPFKIKLESVTLSAVKFPVPVATRMTDV